MRVEQIFLGTDSEEGPTVMMYVDSMPIPTGASRDQLDRLELRLLAIPEVEEVCMDKKHGELAVTLDLSPLPLFRVIQEVEDLQPLSSGSTPRVELLPEHTETLPAEDFIG